LGRRPSPAGYKLAGTPVDSQCLADALQHEAPPANLRQNAAIATDIAAMRLLIALLGLGFACGLARAEPVPLPRPRPPVWTQPRSFAEAVAGLDFDSAAVTAQPTDCDRKLAAEAEISALPRLIGPGACGGGDMVALKAVELADATRVEIKPAPVLRCAMAERLAGWLREAAAPDIKASGAQLAAIDTYGDYECRARNRLAGGKLSEHGKGDAVDLRAFTLRDGRVMLLTDPAVDVHLREQLRDAACRDFTTVLGPGADPFHAGHIHLDLAERHNGYRICEWDVRVPPPVPLPRPRPAVAGAPVKHSGILNTPSIFPSRFPAYLLVHDHPNGARQPDPAAAFAA
jgi:hypothetical protein